MPPRGGRDEADDIEAGDDAIERAVIVGRGVAPLEIDQRAA